MKYVINPFTGHLDAIGTGSGSGGAPADAQYLVLAANAALTAERVFTPSDGLVFVDGGANAAYTLAVSDLYHPFLLMGG